MPSSLRALFCASALAALGCTSHAAVHDAAVDFSTTMNTDASLWSYRMSTTAAHDGAYPLLPTFGAFAGFTGPVAGTSGWAAPGLPAVGVNATGADQFFVGFGPGAQFTWPAGALLMHPGASTLAVVSWRSPSAAVLTIDFSFADLDANPRFTDGVVWSVERNSGAAVLASGSFTNGGTSGARTLSAITVAAGEQIQFIVDRRFDYQGDSTRLSAVITTSPVPEPASWLLGLAGGALVLSRRRRTS